MWTLWNKIYWILFFLKIVWSEAWKGDFNWCRFWTSRVWTLMLWYLLLFPDWLWPYCVHLKKNILPILKVIDDKRERMQFQGKSTLNFYFFHRHFQIVLNLIFFFVLQIDLNKIWPFLRKNQPCHPSLSTQSYIKGYYILEYAYFENSLSIFYIFFFLTVITHTYF